MATATTHSVRMVAKIEALLEANPLATQISIDGQTVTMADATSRLEYYRKRVQAEAGRGPLVGIDLSRA